MFSWFRFTEDTDEICDKNYDVSILIIKAPITTAADDSVKYFFHCF